MTEPAVLFDLLRDPDGPRVVASIAAQRRGMAVAETNADDFGRATVDQAIEHLAGTGRHFTADEIRDLCPVALPPNAYGPRFHAANAAGVIRLVGYRKSTRPEARGRIVSVWAGAWTG